MLISALHCEIVDMLGLIVNVIQSEAIAPAVNISFIKNGGPGNNANAFFHEQCLFHVPVIMTLGVNRCEDRPLSKPVFQTANNFAAENVLLPDD
ncbi:hypothetical protein ATCV1_z536R [Acanthocystis turfacea chlorella virus 1]|uniref:Uncharacterized protein z536R n=1 Tax=Chlorovirus heliozoae TaxID=322019 RepID=A7K9E6_9PHYC|nr:hypothetical protein ATCV1_z536R [Acanthocystis turfacea chlorella virus 1]ABT16670.1 hypothetical protein ATCV1_z536R [Acanthocystis turfacea chlorella virus 1]